MADDTSVSGASSHQPVFTELTREEIDQILARNYVGRLAYSFHDRVDIEPIHYVFDHGWLYGRTSRGTKLTTLAHHSWVAFEVDEIEGLFEWRSVVVKGGFYLVTSDTPAHRDQSFARGIELLRTLIPDTLLENDPTPFRHQLFRIHVDEAHGRRAQMQASKPGK